MIHVYCFLGTVLFFLFLPVLMLIFWRKGLLDRFFFERLGLLKPRFRKKSQYAIWFHGASVGEVKILNTLIKGLVGKRPGVDLFVTTNTYLGRKVAERLLGEIAHVSYAPFDVLPFLIWRFLRVKPSLMVFVETELWPCWIHTAKRMRAKVLILNGRISPRSFERYKKIKALLRDTFSCVDVISAISEEDAKRFIKMGADINLVVVNGNIKLDEVTVNCMDVNLEHLRNECKLRENSRVIVAGSVRRNEVQTVLNSYEMVLRFLPNTDLIIAPRHLEHVDLIRSILSEKGMRYNFRSKKEGVSQGKGNVLILDTMGELARIYAVADVVFLGSSLVPLGGQNPVEPAIWSKPIITGPSYEDFAYIYEELLKRRGAVVVRGPEKLQEAFLKLLEDTRLLKEMGKNAKEAVVALAGATQRNLRILLWALDQRGTKSGLLA